MTSPASLTATSPAFLHPRRRRANPFLRVARCNNRATSFATTSTTRAKNESHDASSDASTSDVNRDHNDAARWRSTPTTMRRGSIRGVGVVSCASGSGTSGGGAVSPTSSSSEPPVPGFTESYSFFNLAAAEFPNGWQSPAARVSYSDSPLDLALMAGSALMRGGGKPGARWAWSSVTEHMNVLRVFFIHTALARIASIELSAVAKR